MTVLEQLIHIDEQVTLWLNTHSPAFLDPVWELFSEVNIWFPFYTLVVAYVFWRLGWKKGLAILLALILTVVLTDQLSYHLKEAIQRLRPCHNAWMLDGGLRMPQGPRASLYGFFSGHASNTFGFAAFTCAVLKKNDPIHSYRGWGWFVYIWATLVSLSRIVLAAHFVGDILAGMVFGSCMGWLTAWLCSAVIAKAKL